MDAERFITVRALKAFDRFEVGEVYVIMLTESVAHLVASDYLVVLEDPWLKTIE